MLAPLKRPLALTTTASRPHLVYELITRLQKRGHEIIIFGTGDTNIPGVEVIPALPKSLVNLPPVENPFYQHTAGITKEILDAALNSNRVDVFHNHLYPEFLGLLLHKLTTKPILTTVHAQMTPELVAVLKLFPEAHLVSISKSHARLGEGLKFDLVYNGIDIEAFRMIQNPTKDYLLFIGRMTGIKDESGNYIDPKGVLTAIEVAKRTDETLYISGNVEDRKFYDEKIKPELSDKIKFIGDVSAEQPLDRETVVKLMQNAKAYLVPINWEEPFGLVMAEANACGTPVIAFRRGSVPELIHDGVNGLIVDTVDQMVEAVKKVDMISREACRKEVEQMFSLERMVDDYVRLYKGLIELGIRNKE